MNHLLIAPIILPALVAPLIIMALRYHIDLQRVFSIASCAVMTLMAIVLFGQAMDGTVQVYELGDWPAPFGIVLVLDRLSALMVLLTSVLGLAVVLYATGSGWDARGANFHALLQFQLMGILGAFLTGDAFNLFVFFEVLLIASYGLMIHAGGAQRFRAGVQYVIINLLGSTLFLFALGTLYATTGTLNMADLALRVAEIPAEQAALLRVGAILLVLVFAIKAALLPLHFWLPGAYANAPLVVAALFAIMTKVGAYSILRFFTLIFPDTVPAGADLLSAWLLPAALATALIGAIGVLGSGGREGTLGRLAAFGAIASVGTLLTSIALMTPEGAAAAVYYIVHSTLTAALMFLICDLVVERRGDSTEPTAPMANQGLLAALFFVAAIALAGMPPLSGFLGKLLVLDAARSHELAVWVWAVVLLSSLITILGLARSGTAVFWKSYATGVGTGAGTGSDDQGADDSALDAPDMPSQALAITTCFALIAGLVGWTVLAGPASDYAGLVAQDLFAPDAYINAVLKPEASQ